MKNKILYAMLLLSTISVVSSVDIPWRELGIIQCKKNNACFYTASCGRKGLAKYQNHEWAVKIDRNWMKVDSALEVIAFLVSNNIDHQDLYKEAYVVSKSRGFAQDRVERYTKNGQWHLVVGGKNTGIKVKKLSAARDVLNFVLP